MCGIVGIYNFDKDNSIDDSRLRRMNNSLNHRGPDGEGYFINQNVGLGHKRLTIIDLESGDQPMVSNCGNYIIVFNGEIYNYLELKAELLTRGHKFKTTSDTEVIIRSYIEWGYNCQNKFNGMWAFALWDKRKQELFLSRDRIGEKPLFYSTINNAFAFASEIKSLFAYGIGKEIREEFIELYLVLTYVPGADTFYKNIFKLLPGHFIIVSSGGFKEHKYWDLPEIEEDNMNNSPSIYEEFEALLEDSVKIRMRSDVPFGAFLSGGLDSSSIVSLMSNISNFPIETFTIGFPDKIHDESELAQLVSNKFNTNHNLGKVNEEEIEDYLEKVFFHFDEPFGDNSAIPTYQVSEYASQKVKMVLTGDGGDEVMSGYPTYAGLKYNKIYDKAPNFIKNNFPKVVGNLSNIVRGNYRFKLHHLQNLLESADKPFIERFCMKKPFTNLLNIKCLTQHVNGVISIEDYVRDFVNRVNYKDDFYKLMFIDLKTRLPDGYLVKVDRMSMANSIETRAPFLDYRLIEFMSGVDKKIKQQGFETKSILKKTIGQQLPKQLLEAKKKGFVAPLTKWLNNDNNKYLLDNLKSASWSLDQGTIQKVLNDNSDNGLFIWQLLILKKFYE